MPPPIRLPKPKDSGESIEFNDVHSLVVVGANGAGKTRLGVWIESNQATATTVHRISAQRSLKLNTSVQPQTLKDAGKMLRVGSNHPSHNNQNKHDIRWMGRPATHLLDDYDALLAWIFAEHREAAVNFREHAKDSQGELPAIVPTKLEAAVRIWSEALPGRGLKVIDSSIRVTPTNGDDYDAAELSDGERVVLYMICQALALPDNSILVVDEPEIHMHPSIQDRLWNTIEDNRPDCVFVYITHDLRFAASRYLAKKIWVKKFLGNCLWDWDDLSDNHGYPDELTLRILGSRKKVLFTEGTHAGLDHAIYQFTYPDWLVVPRESCTNVIASTAAFGKATPYHHLSVCGMIDRDFRDEEELATLKDRSVFSTPYSEVENMFLAPSILTVVSEYLGRVPEDDLNRIKSFLFESLATGIAGQAEKHAMWRFKRQVERLEVRPVRGDGNKSLSDNLRFQLHGIDIDDIVETSRRLFQDILDRKDYEQLLVHYNAKRLPSQIANFLGLKGEEYPSIVLRLFRSNAGISIRIRQAFQGFLPKLPC